MNLRQWMLWEPDVFARGLVLMAGISLTLVLGHVHYLPGLGAEFHVFFALPILLAAWFPGFHRAPDDLESLLNEADRLMYEAKESGRDRILQHVPDEVAR